MEQFPGWLGQLVGTAIRFVVEFLAAMFAGIDDFFVGLGLSLGMSVTLVNLILLCVGVLLLYSGFRRAIRGRLIGAIIRLGLGVLLLLWLIN